MLRTTLYGVVCAATLIVCAGAGAHAEDLTRTRSRNYEVLTDMPGREASMITQHMDGVFAAYAQMLSGYPVRNGKAVRLYLFRTRRAYLQRLAEMGIDATNTAGVFFVRGGEAGLAAFVEGNELPRLRHTLQHEGFHQFAHLRIHKSLPPWLNEGLAEYFGEALLVRGRLEMGLAPERRVRTIAAAVEKNQHFPFAEMLTMSHEDWNATVRSGDPRAHLMYTQAWSMAHFLVHAENGRYSRAFEQYIRAISNGFTSEQAAERAFGRGYEASFEEKWTAFVRAQEPDPLATALERLTFVAEGLRLVHEADERPGSLNDLQARLKERGFGWQWETHGEAYTVSAFDDKMFEAPIDPASRGRPTMRMIAGGDRSLPPGVEISGMRVRAKLVWGLDEEGKLRYDIVFG